MTNRVGNHSVGSLNFGDDLMMVFRDIGRNFSNLKPVLFSF